MRLLGLASPGPIKLHGGARLRKTDKGKKLMAELEGETKVSSMCRYESHCDSKIEAARHRKVGLDCYSCHQSAERLRVLELPHRQGIPRSTCQGALLRGRRFLRRPQGLT
jgi:hypothetical protein